MTNNLQKFTFVNSVCFQLFHHHFASVGMNITDVSTMYGSKNHQCLWPVLQTKQDITLNLKTENL